jgi:dihydrofolate reductase
VASTKRAVTRAADDAGIPFVGGHPMAGRETTGFGAADGSLFQGRPWVVTEAVGGGDPDAVRRLAEGADRDVTVGGPVLAAEALRAGVVDELQLLACPVVVGGGHPALPADLRLDLELLEERRFAGGVVFLRYAIRR